MTAVIESFRAVLFGQPLAWGPLAVAFGLALVVLAVGFVFFRRMEQTFADRI